MEKKQLMQGLSLLIILMEILTEDLSLAKELYQRQLRSLR